MTVVRNKPVWNQTEYVFTTIDGRARVTAASCRSQVTDGTIKNAGQGPAFWMRDGAGGG
jgi:hypothetical protein